MEYSPTSTLTGSSQENISKQRKSVQFWLIFLSLCVTVFLSALEFTSTSNALPVIINELHGKEFAWVGTAYALASTAFLPMSGGIAQIFGRKSAFVAAIAIFAIGSALCGAAQSMNWLIAARTVQGVGGGAIVSLTSIVVSDLVPLRERGAYNGLIGMTWAVAVAIGPLVGGALAQNGLWRWLFYLNLPICGVALILVLMFMNLPTPPGSLREKLVGLDWTGNALVIGSSTSLVIALTWGGVRFPWSSALVLVPLLVGFIGLSAWLTYEIKFASHPMVPPELVGNRTSVSGYVQVFINTLVAVLLIYYIPVYFQACKDASPVRASIDMFGLSIGVGPFVVCGGASVAIFKFYRPQLWTAWILMIVGAGALSTIDATTPIAHPIGLVVIGSAGSGLLFSTTYFPVLSPLPVSENAHALALFAFVRSLAQIWGVTIGSAILTNQLRTQLPRDFLSAFPGGIDLIYSIIPEIPALPQPLKLQVQIAFANSLRPVMYTGVGFSIIGFLTSLFMADVPMHNYVDEKWTITNEPLVEKIKKVPV